MFYAFLRLLVLLLHGLFSCYLVENYFSVSFAKISLRHVKDQVFIDVVAPMFANCCCSLTYLYVPLNINHSNFRLLLIVTCIFLLKVVKICEPMVQNETASRSMMQVFVFLSFKVQNEFWSFGDYELVGHGKVTNSNCGKFLGFRGCARTELHDKTTLDGVNYSGKVFVRKVHCTCHKPTCPVCYKHGWAVREAKMIEARLVECSKHFGQVEHIIVSVPKSDYGLTLESLRSKAVHVVMKNRGVVGGVLIFHAFRYRNRVRSFEWDFSVLKVGIGVLIFTF